MDNIKIMLFEVFYRLREMVIRLEMSLPGDTSSNEGAREKRNEPCRCPGITRREQCHLVPLGYLFLDEIVEHNLRSTIVLGRNGNPQRGNVRDLHRYPLRECCYHDVSTRDRDSSSGRKWPSFSGVWHLNGRFLFVESVILATRRIQMIDNGTNS